MAVALFNTHVVTDLADALVRADEVLRALDQMGFLLDGWNHEEALEKLGHKGITPHFFDHLTQRWSCMNCHEVHPDPCACPCCVKATSL